MGAKGEAKMQLKRTKKTPEPKMVKKAKKSGSDDAPAKVMLQEGGQDMDEKQVLAAVEAVMALSRAGKEGKEKEGNADALFDDDGARMSMQITAIKLPRDERRQLVKIPLPHSPLADPCEVCLIVKDLEKGTRPDHEPTKIHFEALLREKGVAEGTIAHVMPLRELKVEYKQFEAKTQLCHRFDKFLVDDRILRMVPMLLGKPMYKRKRFPTPVNMLAADLPAELAKSIRTSVLPLSHHGTSAMVTIGNTHMEAKAIAENVMTAAKILSARYPGGWKNIRSIHLKSDATASVPVHISTLSANDVGFVDADVPNRVVREAAEDELSTQPGMVIKVTPFGSIKVTKTQDPDWDDEKDEPFVEDSEEEAEEEKEPVEEKKKKKSKKETKKERGQKRKAEYDVASRADKKVKAAGESEDEEEDKELEETELKYMKRVADEEEEMEKKMDKNGAESDEEDEEDDDEDDVSDAEGEEEELDEGDVVVDEDEDEDDDSDSDEELYVKKTADEGDSD